MAMEEPELTRTQSTFYKCILSWRELAISLWNRVDHGSAAHRQRYRQGIHVICTADLALGQTDPALGASWASRLCRMLFVSVDTFRGADPRSHTAI